MEVIMETCFVIMPIGDQTYGNETISADELKKRYDDLIREAIKKAREGIDIVRSDDVSSPGSITTDILTRLMHSTYVIADITFPNPNVFYELGIRHAIRTKTILLKEKDSKWNYFDISHLRYIEYEVTPTGLKRLSEDLTKAFDWIVSHPNRPDNQFLEIASLIKFQYPQFIDFEEEQRKRKEALKIIMLPLLKNAETFRTFSDKTISQEEKNKAFSDLAAKNPDLMVELFESLIDSDFIDLFLPKR
jgi:hypothetical protein